MESPNLRPRERDSHDLSPAFPLARFSILDNLVLSLSDFPSVSPNANASQLYSNYDPNDIYTAADPFKPSPSNNTLLRRRRGHTQSSSMSDYDGGAHIDNISSNYTAFHSRSRQNSTYAKHKTVRNASVRSGHSGVRDCFPESSRHIQGGMGLNVQSSNSSSVDLGATNAMPITTFPSHINPSASFDHSYGERIPKSPTEEVPTDYLTFDAAPMPTIPGGPRRKDEPISPVGYPPRSPKKVAPSRRNSVKSTVAKSVRKSKSQAPVHDHDIRDQAKQFVHATTTMRNGSVAAPSPGVGALRKAYPSSSSNPPTVQKESRPGFFRRVFGSSKNNEKANQTQQEEAQRPPSPATVRQVPGTSLVTRPRTQPNQQPGTASRKNSLSSQPNPPTQADDSPPPPPPLPLRKAHSSFFRRRKKSMSENAIPPVPPLQTPAESSYHHAQFNVIAPPHQSPRNQSLRGAMAQYLNSDKSPNSIGPSPIDTFFDSREHQPDESDESLVLKATLSHPPSFDERVVGAGTPDSAGQGPNQEHLKREGDHDPSNVLDQHPEKLQSTTHARPSVNGEIEGGSFLINTSSNEAMGQPSPTERPPHKLLQRQYSAPGSSEAFGRTQSNKENISPHRRANAPERRTEAPLLSPISDRSHILTMHHEPTSRLFDADDDDEYDNEDTFVVRPPRIRDAGPPRSAGSNRVWLEPISSDEKLPHGAHLTLPLDSQRATVQSYPSAPALLSSPRNEAFVSATSLPTVQLGDMELRMSQDWSEMDAAKALLAHDIETTEGDMRRARQIFDGDESFVSKAGAAAWLGQTTPTSSRTRRAYMDLFDWNGVNMLAAFRELCGKLLVKAESQQLDRVIDAFSERWCNCNPNHGFKDRDIVHTITFSILMLNTDLHIADIDQRMTRSQFVKNTLPTIRSMAEAIEIDATETIRAQARNSKGKIPWDHSVSRPSSPAFPEPPTSDTAERTSSIDVKRASNRLSLRVPMSRMDSDQDGVSEGCNVLVKAPFEGTMKGWDFQVEIVLKEFYNSIRQQRLPLHGASVDRNQTQAPQTGLSVVTNALRRTPSVLSKAPSESVSYRGRSSEAGRFTASRFASKTRSRPKVYPSSTVGSSRTSLDDASVWSPAGSTWSKYTLGQTHTSMSVNSLGSHFAQGDYHQAIGFANALSQAIIREEGGSDEYNGRVVPLLEDETLELVGAPWAKEGMLKHKHHLETLEKKAKDRNWSECFAVIEKGWMKIFSFSTTSKSNRARAKSRAASGGGPVGGGNWMENAEQVNSFLLRQTIASALPPPGYSKSRPNVFALSLPTGAVHLFQVGTPDIVQEFVSTANYWSARLSKEPLFGSVSNVEYGWGEAVLNTAASQSRPVSRATIGHGSAPGTSSSNVPAMVSSGRHSVMSPASPERQGIGRRSEDQGPCGTTWKTRLPGDKAIISDWTPPVQSMMASQLMEVDQLRGLTAYVANVEEELKKHNELRPLMGLAVSCTIAFPDVIRPATNLVKKFSPRHPNAAKAMANWEKKSAYLLREIVKFRTYIDSLTSAQAAKEKFYKEREELIRKGDEAMQASNTLGPLADNDTTTTTTTLTY
ncbi:hypothetical protein E2P81_ATG07117 [Venturia nashicola]|uniref:SEC7 domain-containing protein n=1 Tax=Venturia nashicola TaxID=86259 RepID=A0A4Z1NJR5_9PEZI|nr:hypothetical protein E6O75_ATG07282 [Venturia nashicola]TLD19500.1 hypothetical protein E2P81_ATG07117 [Venturia nashicola]